MITKNSYLEMGSEVRPHEATNAEGTKEFVIQVIWLMVGTLLSLNSFTWPIGQVVLGIGFWRTFAILHACGHGAFFKSHRLNDLVGFFLSPLCFIPYYPWKYIHQDHHVWTGWKDIDPTTRGLMKTPKSWQLTVLNFCWKTWIPLISAHYICSLFFDIKHSSLNILNRKKIRSVLSICWVAGFHLGLIAIFGTKWLTIFALSSFIYLNMGDISLLTQHVHLPLDLANGEEVKPKPLWEQDHYSHTMILPAFADKWLVLGFNHHALHHLFPRLPYYKTQLIAFQGTHTHDWKEWILKSKKMKATDLIYHTESGLNNAHDGFSEGIDTIALNSEVIIVHDDNRPIL